jgi:WD40 repeat protein
MRPLPILLLMFSCVAWGGQVPSEKDTLGTAVYWKANSTAPTLPAWGNSDPVYSVAFSPDGSRVLTGSYDKTAVLRDAKTGQTLRVWKHDAPVSSVAFSPDGKKILIGSSDRTAVLQLGSADLQSIMVSELNQLEEEHRFLPEVFSSRKLNLEIHKPQKRRV